MAAPPPTIADPGRAADPVVEQPGLSLQESWHSPLWSSSGSRPQILPFFAASEPSSGALSERGPETYQDEIRRGLLPAFATLTPRQVQTWLATQPGVSADLAVILTDVSGDPDLIALARAQAGLDASLLRKGIHKGPGADVLAVLDRATQVLTDINARIEYGSRLTRAEATYIRTWATTVGALNLGRLYGLVRRSLENPIPERTSPIRRAAITSRLGPVADAVLNYSNTAHHQAAAVVTDDKGDVTLPNMPRAIQVLAGVRIGEPTRADLNRRVLSGWSRLMACASENVAGGRSFSLALADQAIAHCDSGQDRLAHRSASIERSANRLLSIAARHDDAAADLLIDDSARETLLSHRWSVDRGVVDLIAAGTDRDPADGGGTALQASAARALIDDVGLHAPRYLGAMTEATSDAIVDVGIAWIDQFGGDGERPTAGRLDRDPHPGLDLSPGTEARFLRFVAATGDSDTIRFHAAARHQGQAMLAAALACGDPTRPEAVMNQIGRLEGRIIAADIAHQVERPRDSGQLDETYSARQRQAAAVRLAAEILLMAPPGQGHGRPRIEGRSDIDHDGNIDASAPASAALLNTASAKVQAGYLNALFEAHGPPADDHAQETGLSETWLTTLVDDARADQRRLLVQAALDAGVLPIDLLSQGAVQIVNGQPVLDVDTEIRALDQACTAIPFGHAQGLTRCEAAYAAAWQAGLGDSGLTVRPHFRSVSASVRRPAPD